jgi:hypothetical protein
MYIVPTIRSAPIMDKTIGPSFRCALNPQKTKTRVKTANRLIIAAWICGLIARVTPKIESRPTNRNVPLQVTNASNAAAPGNQANLLEVEYVSPFIFYLMELSEFI